MVGVDAGVDHDDAHPIALIGAAGVGMEVVCVDSGQTVRHGARQLEGGHGRDGRDRRIRRERLGCGGAASEGEPAEHGVVHVVDTHADTTRESMRRNGDVVASLRGGERDDPLLCVAWCRGRGRGHESHRHDQRYQSGCCSPAHSRSLHAHLSDDVRWKHNASTARAAHTPRIQTPTFRVQH